MSLWDVLPDSERQQWTFDPFVSVGPLRFGMGSGETSAVLGGIRATVRHHDPHRNIACHSHPEAGLPFPTSRCWPRRQSATSPGDVPDRRTPRQVALHAGRADVSLAFDVDRTSDAAARRRRPGVRFGLDGQSVRLRKRELRRYRDEIGLLVRAGPQDRMCEPDMITKTGLSLREHIDRTVGNFFDLAAEDPGTGGVRRPSAPTPLVEDPPPWARPQTASSTKQPKAPTAQADAAVRHHRADRHALHHRRPPQTHRQTAQTARRVQPWRVASQAVSRRLTSPG
ncbi:DUF7221 family queuine tRNA-ribosyltransferase-like protein, partial [Streptomyces sp. NRRL S-813]|uniref:deazapurine DNA modification protein DpdA family protein n=1 Tax=Streptomyces sp. NRRL S-813 TaxID=1463919 RepID=UPI003B63A99C